MVDAALAVDPAVSRTKFAREVARYRANEDEYLGRGCLLLKAEFPEVFVVFAVPQVNPPAIAFGALLNFTGYDVHPPSVRLVNPFTRLPYRAGELPLPARLLRRTNVDESEGAPAQFTALMAAYSPDEIPFLCLPGVREYHNHPAHTGDPWLLHRSQGEGTLHFIIDTLYRYGVQPMNGYAVSVQVIVDGLMQPDAPA